MPTFRQGRSELRQDRQFGAPPLGRLRLGLEQRQGAAEMLDRFAVGGTAHHPLAGLAPIDDRLDGPAGILQVMGDDLGRSCRSFAARREEGVGDPRMQQLARPAQQCAVGCILDQRVLE